MMMCGGSNIYMYIYGWLDVMSFFPILYAIRFHFNSQYVKCSLHSSCDTRISKVC